MKKLNTVMLLTLVLALALSLCACGKAVTSDGGTQAVNPITEITAEDACKALGLKDAGFGPDATVESVASIDGNPVIYSFDLKVNGQSLNARIALAKNGNAGSDISGVYLAAKAEEAIFDSATTEVPSVHAGADKDYARAYCEWNGYYFSLSGEKLTVESIANLCMQLAPTVIGNDNLTGSN